MSSMEQIERVAEKVIVCPPDRVQRARRASVSKERRQSR